MLSRGTFFKIVGVVLVAITIQNVARIVVRFGAFSHFFQHYPGLCKKVENIQRGSEEFYTLPDGLTFITSGFRTQNMGPAIDDYFLRHKLKGRLYLFDFKKAEEGVKELKIASTEQFDVDNFQAHGIGIWEDKKAGHHVVFVVNHAMDEPVADRIEKFIFDPDKLELKHHSSYSGDAFLTANSVQATGENSFYFTNYQYFSTSTGNMIQGLLELPWTNVVYYDGKDYTTAADGFISANGIAMSLDGRFIYVADCLGMEIRVFRRNPDNSLSLQQTYPMHTIPDNILVDQKTGDLYVGCHPIGYKILLHLEHPDEFLAPSQVLQLKVREGNITSAQELFYDHGELISASSAATIYNGQMLIGSVMHNLVTCGVNVPLDL